MKRDAVLAKLRAHESDLRKRGMHHLYLFGSVARDDAVTGSDVDLFFDFNSPDFSLIDLIELQNYVSDMLSARTDLITRGSLHPALREGIERSALQVY
jgi:predicted nucleotidyltransferase